jgi:hypothetical protein
VAPVVFGRLTSGMMASMPNTMGPGGVMEPSSRMEGMMDSVGRAFGMTLLYSLLVAGWRRRRP